ncbi:MAG: DUF692 domain-containing protein [Burkholderiales bacterium]
MNGTGASAALPVAAGVGLRAPHVRHVLATRPPVPWFEVHSENYFGDGGPALDALLEVRADYPIALHGVGLSLGSADPLDRGHLARLAQLVQRVAPSVVSEHLCWSGIDGRHFNDLLPLPYTEEALAHVCARVDAVQSALGRPILVENVSSYYAFPESTLPEYAFVAEVARRTGCGLLVDVNNIFVNAHNHGVDARAFLAAMPAAAVAEIHLAGYEARGELLIDTHGAQVADAVWTLFREAIARFGPVPTLVEWDNDIPAFAVLAGEAATAQAILEAARADAR